MTALAELPTSCKVPWIFSSPSAYSSFQTGATVSPTFRNSGKESSRDKSRLHRTFPYSKNKHQGEVHSPTIKSIFASISSSACEITKVDSDIFGNTASASSPKINLLPLNAPLKLANTTTIDDKLTELSLFSSPCCIPVETETSPKIVRKLRSSSTGNADETFESTSPSTTVSALSSINRKDYEFSLAKSSSSNDIGNPSSCHSTCLKRKSKEALIAEYDELGRLAVKNNSLHAQYYHNRAKNRYFNILPYDDSRVTIHIPTKYGSDYINASHIHVKDRHYIAAQAPPTNAFEDFWQMVWEQCSPCIVILTNLVENGKRKADRYWPERVGDEQAYGNIRVRYNRSYESKAFCIRSLLLKNELEQASPTREVFHFHFLKWPDQSVPDGVQEMFRLRRYMHAFTELAQSRQNLNGPCVVQCSAGIGRTGTFIAMQVVLDGLSSTDNKSEDIASIVKQLREQRVGMVQTFDQYRFIYDCLYEWLEPPVGIATH